MVSSSLFQTIWPLLILFVGAACIEAVRERKTNLYYARGFALCVASVAAILVAIPAAGPVAPTGEMLVKDDLVSHGSKVFSYISYIKFSGVHLFSILSVGVLLAGILFSPSAPLVRVRMSRVFGLQALLIGLIHIRSIEWFLVLGALLMLSLILSMRHACKNTVDDDQRLMRARAFTLYQGTAVLCMGVSLLLRCLDAMRVLPYSDNLGMVDMVCMCVASTIVMGIFPFHGWVLPFLSSPRTTIFLPMFCIQTGLLFFFRVYAPIVSIYSHHSLLFVGLPVIGLLYASLLFFGESRLKRIPGNLYLSHVCLMAISVVGLDVTSFTSAVLDGVNTLVATLGLLGLCAMLTSRFGVRGVLVPTGLGSFFPEIAVCYLVCVLSLVSFPGTLGFIEEEVLLGQAVGHQNMLVAVIAIALTLNGFSSFRLFARVFMGQPVLGQDGETKLLVRERLIIYAILAVIIVNGLAPSFIVDSLSHMER